MMDYDALKQIAADRQATIRAEMAPLRGVMTRAPRGRRGRLDMREGAQKMASTRLDLPAWGALRWAALGMIALAMLLAAVSPAGAAGTVKCTPNNAPVGTPINVAMAGLPAGETVTVMTMNASGGVLTRRDLTVGADGSLSLDLNTSADAPGDYTVQALNKAGATLAQGRYTLTAAARLPNTGAGYAAGPEGRRAPIAPVAAGALAGAIAVAITARRRARRGDKE